MNLECKSREEDTSCYLIICQEMVTTLGKHLTDHKRHSWNLDCQCPIGDVQHCQHHTEDGCTLNTGTEASDYSIRSWFHWSQA